MENNIQLKFRGTAKICSYIVIMVCIVVFIGWQLDIEAFKRPIPGLTSMNPVTTLGCIFCAIAALILNKQEYNFQLSVLLNLLAFFVILIGFLRILTLSGGPNAEVDMLLYRTKLSADALLGDSYHMAPNTAVNLMLLGLSLVFSQFKGYIYEIIGNYTALMALLISLFVILGYAYLVDEFYNVLSFFPMSIHTAICFTLLAVAILFSNGNAGFINILMSENQGGRVARYMLPFVLLVPLALGYIRLWLHWQQPMSVGLGVSLLVTCIIIVFYIVTQYISRRLDKIDAYKAQAERKLVEYTSELELKNIELERSRELQTKIIGEVEEYSIIMLDPSGRVEQWNKGATKIKGYESAEIIGKHFSAFYPKDDQEKGLPDKHLKMAVEQGKAITEGWRVKKDGSLFWASVAITPLYDGNRKVFGFSKFTRDFTKIKRLEEQLREFNLELEKKVEERTKEVSDYKFALDESSIVAITDQRGIIQYVNDNFCKISKYSRRELIGQDHRIINSGYHPKSFIRDLWVTIANGRIWRGELKNKAKDGTAYWVDTTIVPFRNETGKPYQYVAIRFDITQRKEGEEIRKKLEEEVNAMSRELAGVFDRISDGFIMLDHNYQYTYVNKKIGELVNLPPESLIGKCIWEQFPESKYSETFDAYKKAMKEQQYIYNIDYYKPLDLWYENHIYPSPDKLSVFIRDISEEKRSQEKIAKSEQIYKTIASGIPGSMICLFDPEYRYLLAEGDMLEKLGYSKERIIGQKAEDVLPADRLATILPDLERVFKGEFFSRHLSRPEYDIMIQYVPLIDENNYIYAAMTVAIDTSELQDANRKILDLNINLEKKVQERTEQLQVLNKELEAFSYSVSHDLRTPLRAVNGYAKILEEDYAGTFDEEGKRLLNVIQYNASRMGSLIDDLLSFSRLGRKEINKQMVNMDDLVRKVIEELKLNNEIKATINIGKLHSPMADYTLLYQVFINLVSNAVKYSSKNPEALVQLSSEEQENFYVYKVSDNGVGFDTRYAHKLFGVFQRLHTSEEFEGTGVGLAIVEKLVSKHGGEIWAESEIGKGATFYISLPK